ncbi:MAG: sn-glycerol-3-phosphate ABC transporter permease UgpE [Anaerolineales bacterium]|nr:sn-glycerol-3-phosphate ABC transporter permease UgpE [Anaerolineales bacterium]
MIAKQLRNLPAHLILAVAVVVFAFPVYLAVIGSTWDAGTIGRGQMPLTPGPNLIENYTNALTSAEGGRVRGIAVQLLLWNSLLMAVAIAVGKIIISILSAYAVAFFRFPLRMFFFGMIFLTLMLPIEVRIAPTYKVMSDLGLINTFAGLTIPLMASATGTLLFRQFFLTIPDEYVEAAKLDGAGPLRFFWSIVLPLSRTNIAALFVILFIYGWNQYLWPLLITTSRGMETIVIGIVKMMGTGEAQTDWNLIMASTVLALLPPVLVVMLMQQWFVKGLVQTEK